MRCASTQKKKINRKTKLPNPFSLFLPKRNVFFWCWQRGAPPLPSPCASDACCPERSPPAPGAAAGVPPRAVRGWVPSYCVPNRARGRGWVPAWPPGRVLAPGRVPAEGFLPWEDPESTSSPRALGRGSCGRRARLSRSCRRRSWKSPRTGHRKGKLGLGRGSCPRAQDAVPRAKPLLTKQELVSDPSLVGFAKPRALGTRKQFQIHHPRRALNIPGIWAAHCYPVHTESEGFG